MKIYQQRTLHVDGLSEILVTTSSLDIEMVQTEDQMLTAELTGEGSDELAGRVELDVHAEGDAAVIHVRTEGRFFVFGITGSIWNKWLKAVIHVPARIYEKVGVAGQSGDISIRQIIAGKLSLSSKSGDIAVEDCEAKRDLTADSTSGDIRITGVLAKEKVSAHASSGDVVLRSIASDFLEVGTHSGDVTVSDFRGRLAAGASSGDIDLKNDQLTGDLTARASSGDITMAFSQEPESFAINYQGSSGEGKVRIKGLLYEEKSEHRMIGQKGDGHYRIDVRTSSGDFVLE
ncbi:hypothetical protein E4665_14965 [Sporolactobacillus shoreae]|uniref:DUF4097 domain-containing protein n=1 Tax=Sporolactobacillus shoreae TaxID=1465501 RepID=A0A4Z0GLD2_9BACL|nr:DUF4097 family beta strand repeat-containing protein [Sporolactobacillus shoreae]TGA96595.1 hypothetical protein E4665_14965 [Sporolactobacillus shoreae]